MVRGKKITREEIIFGIKSAAQEGVDLRSGPVQRGPARVFYRTHKRYFKSWKAALKSAGISYEDLEAQVKEARRQEYLLSLRGAYEQGVNLNAGSLQRDSEHRGFYDRAKTYYRGQFFWEEALKDAGLPVNEIIKQKRWDRQRVVLALKARKQARKKLNHASVNLEERDLAKAAKKHFGSYDAALEAAGIDSRSVRVQRERYSPLEITLKIIQHHSSGNTLNLNDLLGGDDAEMKQVVYAAQRRRGGWSGAVETAGIDYDQFRKRVGRGYWDRDKVIGKIKEIQEEGISLNPAHISAHESGLYHAATRFAGGWRKALASAGIDPNEVMLQGPPMENGDLLARIRELSEQGQDLSTAAMSQHSQREFRRVYQFGIRRYGSWAKAIIEAGLPYDQIRKSRGQYTEEELFKLIHDFESQGIRLAPSELWDHPGGRGLHHAVIRRYDSWRDFLVAAGINPEAHSIRMDWKNGDQVLEYLRENFPAGVVTGATRDRNFGQAICMYYADIRDAVRKAGLIYSKSGKVTTGMLEDPENVGILYRCNAEFLQQIADKIFFGARQGKRRTLEQGDMVNEGFMKFLEILPDKPPKKGIREFTYWPIRRALLDRNKELFGGEVTFGDEVYFDLFRAQKD